MIRLLIRARFASFAAVALLLVALLAFGRHVTYEQSIQSFFADDDPAVISYRASSASFGNDQFVFVCYDDPELLTRSGMDRVSDLARAIGHDQIDGVVRVESLDAMPVLWEVDDRLLMLESLPSFARNALLRTIKRNLGTLGQAGSGLTIGSAVRSANPTALASLKSKITAHPLFRGTVIDATGTTTALVARLKGAEEHDAKLTIAALREKADQFAKSHRLSSRPAIVGPPVLLADGFASIERDGQRLALAGMALIGLVTFLATRSVWWATVPIVAGWTVWLATETVLSLLGLKLSLSGGPLVAQIIVLTMPAASHLALHFRDDRLQSGDRIHAARSTLAAVTVPILWCAATGTIGYGALLTSNVVPIRQFGAVLAICTAVAAVLTLAISPFAMIPPFRPGGPEIDPPRPAKTSAMNRLTDWVGRHPAGIVVGTLAIVLPLAAGMARLVYESNYINAFKPETRVVRDYQTVESRLGGIGLVSLVVPVGARLDADVLAKFREMDRRVARLRRPDGTAGISGVVSLATVLDPDGRLAALPAEARKRALATKLDLIAASPQADLLKGFWNPKTGKARSLVRILERQPAPIKVFLFAQAEALAGATFGRGSFLTGLSHLLTQTTRGVIATQWTTFFWSTGSILLMLTIAFSGLRPVALALVPTLVVAGLALVLVRWLEWESATPWVTGPTLALVAVMMFAWPGPRLAILAMLPTLLAVGLALGLMGWIGVKLDIATALVASVALGLSVDDTFHCLLQFRRYRRTLPFEESLRASYAVTGPGVLLSSLAVAIGFAVLRFSEFVPFSNFGTMVGIATAGSSLGNLILLPACLTLGNRWRCRSDVVREPLSVGVVPSSSS